MVKFIDLAPAIGSEVGESRDVLLGGGKGGELRALLEERGVLVIRDAHFDDAEQVAFARSLGEVRLGSVKAEGAGGVLVVSFDEKENPAYSKYFGGTFYWHMDGTYDEIPPLATVLIPQALSSQGGQTQFANTYAAFADLPEAEQQHLESLRVVHTVDASHRPYNPRPDAETQAWWDTFPVRVHPLVWTHRSGRKSLVLGASCDVVVGMSRSESDALLQRLTEWTTQPRYVYSHDWRLGDAVVWDNTGTMHRVLRYDPGSGRKMHRVTIEGEELLA